MRFNAIKLDFQNEIIGRNWWICLVSANTRAESTKRKCTCTHRNRWQLSGVGNFRSKKWRRMVYDRFISAANWRLNQNIGGERKSSHFNSLQFNSTRFRACQIELIATFFFLFFDSLSKWNQPLKVKSIQDHIVYQFVITKTQIFIFIINLYNWFLWA